MKVGALPGVAWNVLKTMRMIFFDDGNTVRGRVRMMPMSRLRQQQRHARL